MTAEILHDTLELAGERDPTRTDRRPLMLRRIIAFFTRRKRRRKGRRDDGSIYPMF